MQRPSRTAVAVAVTRAAPLASTVSSDWLLAGVALALLLAALVS